MDLQLVSREIVNHSSAGGISNRSSRIERSPQHREEFPCKSIRGRLDLVCLPGTSALSPSRRNGV